MLHNPLLAEDAIRCNATFLERPLGDRELPSLVHRGLDRAANAATQVTDPAAVQSLHHGVPWGIAKTNTVGEPGF